MQIEEEQSEREWSYASRVGTIALVTHGTLSSDLAIGIRVGIRGDVAGAATAVGSKRIGHLCSSLTFKIRVMGRRTSSRWPFGSQMGQNGCGTRVIYFE